MRAFRCKAKTPPPWNAGLKAHLLESAPKNNICIKTSPWRSAHGTTLIKLHPLGFRATPPRLWLPRLAFGTSCSAKVMGHPPRDSQIGGRLNSLQINYSPMYPTFIPQTGTQVNCGGGFTCLINNPTLRQERNCLSGFFGHKTLLLLLWLQLQFALCLRYRLSVG